jgi:MFS transporter, DHA2 family, multidrug resistance protein
MHSQSASLSPRIGDQREGLSPVRWLAVTAVGLSIFLSALDATIVALASPIIARQFHLSDSLASAIFLAYSVPLTLLILPSAELMRRFRTLPLFLSAVVGFCLGSIVCGLAPTLPALLVGRVIQGSFAALIATQGIAVAASVVAPTERGRAMGLIGSLAPLGAVAGPGIGGLLLTRLDWHAIFFVNVPIGAAAIVLGLISLRGVGLARGAQSGFHQMIGLLRRPQFLWGLLGFLASTTVASGLYFLFPFDLTGIQRYGSAIAGLLLLCVPLGMGVMGILGGYLTDRFGAPRFTLIGSSLLLVGLLLLGLVLVEPTAALNCAWRLLLIGAGIGLFTGPNQTLLMSAGPRETMASASALSNLSARLGSVIGPLALGILWGLLPGMDRQMVGGVTALTLLAAFTVLAAWIASREKPKISVRAPLRQSMGDSGADARAPEASAKGLAAH